MPLYGRTKSGLLLPATLGGPAMGADPMSVVGSDSEFITSTTATFTSKAMGIGPASASRLVVAGFIMGSSGTTLNSFKFGGSGGTDYIANAIGDTDNRIFCLIPAIWAAGTTVVFEAALSGSEAGCAFFAIAFDNALSATAEDSASANGNASGVSVSYSAGGAVVGAHMGGNSGLSVTWTDLTERYDAGHGTGQASLADDVKSAAGSVSISSSSASGINGYVYASFR